jgi:uncharacterized membrane protein YeiH
MYLQFYLEHFGVSVAALTGILAARGKRVDLFGIEVLGLVTAFGGGTLRDLMLGYVPVAWIRDSSYAINAAVTAAAAFFIARRLDLPRAALLVADAFVLALFAGIGVEKAYALNAAAPIAVAMGVITGVAGGIGRDVLLGSIPIVFRRETHLYATAAFLGSACHAVLHAFWPEARWVLPVAVGVTLCLRLAGIRWKIGLPVFASREELAQGGRGTAGKPTST